MAVCRRCGNQMADTAAACPACGELRYQPPQAAASPQQYGAPQPQPAQHYPQQQQYAPQPQQAYAAPQPAYAMPVSAEEARGFIGALFDLSFTSFITTKLIKILYIIFIIGAGLSALGMVGSGFMIGTTAGLVYLILAPLAFLAFVVVARVYLELVIVIFRGAEHLAEIARQTKR